MTTMEHGDKNDQCMDVDEPKQHCCRQQPDECRMLVKSLGSFVGGVQTFKVRGRIAKIHTAASHCS
eukprot:1784812-Amphidinium_carterae.1